MKTSSLRIAAVLLVLFLATTGGLASAYDAHPRLVVVIVIDQFRGDYLERYRDQFGEGGFRLFLDHGAYFTDCNYNYANTYTGPGHATLFTGTYSAGHGIMANEWWDPQKQRMVTSVEDDTTTLVGSARPQPGASPHNLLSETLGDVLKLSTQGKSRVFSISLKDRAAILPGGFSADGVYWVDPNTGNWITSTYYRAALPPWVQDINSRLQKEVATGKDSTGKALPGKSPRELAATPAANDEEFNLARELIVQEHLGSGPATDLMAISLSANDILGHRVGPDAPEMQAMALAMDKQLADFFAFLGRQIGLANIWIALSADHGVAALPSVASKLRIPAANMDDARLRAQINDSLTTKFSPGHRAEYVAEVDYPVAWLNDSAFAGVHVREQEAEQAVGDALLAAGLRSYFTRTQLARGEAPNTPFGHKFLNSYSPHGGWYVIGVPPPYYVGSPSGTSHGTPYSYDTHVPLALYGVPFQPGTYRAHSEPVDLAVTLASLLGINAPSHAVGRVLTEALADRASRPRTATGGAR